MSATVDPSLVAGLELHAATGVVHNSLAHDLDQIATAMRDDD
jgi:F-type H+-transporting ATPase subunit b